MTPLDQLCSLPFHDAPQDVRARILSRLADTELFVALIGEPTDDLAQMRMFDLPDATVVLAADEESRLADFLGEPTAFVALPGRVLAGMLSDEAYGLMLNPGRPSEMLLPPELLGWLARSLDGAPDESLLAPRRLAPPDAALVAMLAEPLGERLQDMHGLVQAAWLVAADWQDGSTGHAILIEGAASGDQPRIAKALAELLAFLPPMPGPVDVSFVETADLPAGALRLEIPEPQVETRVIRAPGSDPDKPPILR